MRISRKTFSDFRLSENLATECVTSKISKIPNSRRFLPHILSVRMRPGTLASENENMNHCPFGYPANQLINLF